MAGEAATLSGRKVGFLDRADLYLRVVHALMLRDMRTRFGSSHWGWGVAVLWPVAHVMILTAILVFRKIPSPMDASPMVFVASGATPVLAFQYLSRELMKGVMANKPLTYYPQVKIFDVIVARIIVEIVGAFLGLGVVCAVILACGYDPLPKDIMLSLCGYLTALLLGIGLGMINVGIVAIFPGWFVGYMLLTILLYILSGVAFMPCYLPHEIYAAFKWNPLVQIVEWVRLGYDPGLPVQIDYLYVVLTAISTLSLGLLMERYVVRRVGV